MQGSWVCSTQWRWLCSALSFWLLFLGFLVFLRNLVCEMHINSKVTIFLKKIFYLFMRDTERQRHRQKEKQASYREPDVRLDPRILGSWPEPVADAQPQSHPGAPSVWYKFNPFFILLFEEHHLKMFAQFYWDIIDINHCIKMCNMIWYMYILRNDYHSKFR